MAKEKLTSKKAKLINEQAEGLANYAATVYMAADQLQIKTDPVQGFPLDEDERVTLAEVSALPASLKMRLAKESSDFTVVDATSMLMAISESFPDAEPWKRRALLSISKKLKSCLRDNMLMPKAKRKKSKPTDTE